MELEAPQFNFKFIKKAVLVLFPSVVKCYQYLISEYLIILDDNSDKIKIYKNTEKVYGSLFLSIKDSPHFIPQVLYRALSSL